MPSARVIFCVRYAVSLVQAEAATIEEIGTQDDRVLLATVCLAFVHLVHAKVAHEVRVAVDIKLQPFRDSLGRADINARQLALHGGDRPGYVRGGDRQAHEP